MKAISTRVFMASALVVGFSCDAPEETDGAQIESRTLKFEGEMYTLQIVDGGLAEAFELGDAQDPIIFIPKGFPADHIPPDLDDYRDEISLAPSYDGEVEVLAHQADTAHWSQYYWDGQLQSGTRAFWLLDRTLGGEAPWFNAFAYNWQNAYGPAIGGNWPQIAYIRDTNYIGACDVLWWKGYSFTTACTRDYHGDGHNVLGVAIGPVGAHKGLDAQPTIFIDPGLPEPYTRYNVIAHEMGHIMGQGHNTEQGTASVMNATLYYPDNQYRGFTTHDLDQFRAEYAHAGD